MSSSAAREQRFRGLYAEHVDPLLGYALRRVDRPEDASDVVADTFLVAWRRLADVPEGAEARLWLYGVARRTLANQRRGEGRRRALEDRMGSRLREQLGGQLGEVRDIAHGVVERATIDAALDRLADRDREVLRLAAWEGLEPREIAAVLGVSAIAVRTRLSRSRARLRAMTAQTAEAARNDGDDPGHVRGMRSMQHSLVPPEVER